MGELIQVGQLTTNCFKPATICIRLSVLFFVFCMNISGKSHACHLGLGGWLGLLQGLGRRGGARTVRATAAAARPGAVRAAWGGGMAPAP